MVTKGFLRAVEEKLGLPPLDKVAEGLGKFPDAKQLQLIKQVLEAVERVSRTGTELDNILHIIREINSMPVEKLENLERVLKRLDGIIKKAPQELITLLSNLKDE